MSANGASICAIRRPATTPGWNDFVHLFKRLTHAVLLIALLLGMAGAGLRAYDYILAPANFPIVSVVVEGRFQYIDRETVQRTVLAYSRKGFFAMGRSSSSCCSGAAGRKISGGGSSSA